VFPLRSEARETVAVGYYEGLINAPLRDTTERAPQPPPGWLPFAGDATGIVHDVPSYLRWEMRANLNIRWNGNVFRTNSLGFRSPEVELEKPAETYRILVFGSSNTMGFGVDDDDVYPRHLERWLNEWVRPTNRVEVVNLAIAGDSPTRRLARLQKEAGRFNADWLLCDASALDPWLEDAHIHAVLQHSLPVPFSFVREAIRRSGVSAVDSIESFRDKFQGESERMFDDVYAGWSSVARQLHVPLTLLILPRGDSKAKSPRVFRLIRSLADRYGLDYLDVSGAFDRLPVEEFRDTEFDTHPNAHGHRVIFEAIRAVLLSRVVLPGLSSSSSPAAEVHDCPTDR
jgi:lysophospholipase L1-like esterase